MAEIDDFEGVSHISDPLQRLSAVLAIWRDKLVSFDGRNRQLYYKRLKSGDVDFQDRDIDPATINSLLIGKTVKVSTLYPEIFSSIKAKTNVDLSLDSHLEVSEDLSSVRRSIKSKMAMV